MNLKKIILNDFKCFSGKNTFYFEKLNLIDGANGKGKTTLGKDSLLFALHGYNDQSLDKLVTKGKKKCSVDIVFDNMTITRECPTKLTIEGLEFANNRETQKHLNKTFKDIDYFRKFRMLDLTQGINILEAGKTALTKTLLKFHQDYFNKIRVNLQAKKREREIYNKDSIVYKYFPSEKRLNILNIAILDITERIYSLDGDIRNALQEHREVSIKESKKEQSRHSCRTAKENIMKDSKCPTCKRLMDKNLKVAMLNDINTELKELNEAIINLLPKVKDSKDLYNYLNNLKNDIIKDKAKLSNLRLKLETRIKQKEYKWTNKDILILKKAIEELDKFTSYYITEWIKVLEPIINNIINRIGFYINFIISSKGTLDISLTKDNKEYTYKDLSSGQKLIITIAFQIALLLEKGEEGLIVADEGFSSLDSENLNYVLELFKTLPFQLICMLHRVDNVPDGINIIRL